jgi:hypothetical protein
MLIVWSYTQLGSHQSRLETQLWLSLLRRKMKMQHVEEGEAEEKLVTVTSDT